ncbi:hypothetical protein Fmac_014195 [Flemingia macrophylla]|uniref:Protein kinase domain-containing protein n=1 Tax=Flemingia macrophylla TaxID=520843 RepID=A0ABD1MB05_9FABA
MGSWIRGKCIGKGAFGSVSVALRKRDGLIFAVKSVGLKTGLPGQLEALENEIRILQRLSYSPHVVKFLGHDATCEHRNLHMEYLPGGTLGDLDADVDESLVRNYTWCLVSALRHVHANGVVHCDVKGRNVLVAAAAAGTCKLADFGSAAELGLPAPAVPRGSPLWMAPEVIRGERQGPAADVWSLGCTVVEMLTGKPPWRGSTGADALRRIGFSGEVPEFPRRLSEIGRDFLEKCLRREARRRWSCDQLLQHPFLLPCSAESSPRCVLDRVNSVFGEFDEDEREEEIGIESEAWARGRIGKLAIGVGASWETEDWMVVRELASAVKEEIVLENIEIRRVEEAIHVGTNLESERVKLDESEDGWSWSMQCGWENGKKLTMRASPSSSIDKAHILSKDNGKLIHTLATRHTYTPRKSR